MRERCDTIREEMTRWLDGELTPAAAEHFKSHLRGCEECRELLARREDFTRQWQNSAPLTSTAADRQAIMEAAIRQSATNVSIGRSFRERFISGPLRLLSESAWLANAVGAAGVLAIILIGLNLHQQVFGSYPPPQWQHSAPVYSRVEYEAHLSGNVIEITDENEFPTAY